MNNDLTKASKADLLTLADNLKKCYQRTGIASNLTALSQVESELATR